MLRIGKILCPTDFSKPSASAMKLAAEIAKTFNAELYIVHVVTPIPMIPAFTITGSEFNIPKYEEEIAAYTQKKMTDLIDRELSRKDIALRPVIVKGDAAEEIISVATRENADMIVIATHGTSGMRRFVFGSVTDKILKLCNRPVLVIPAEIGEEEAR